MAKTAFEIFQSAEIAYHGGDTAGALKGYVAAIRKILRNEPVTATIPPHMHSAMPQDMPLQLLGVIWRNFVGFFRDKSLNFTDQYKFLTTFRPGTSKEHTQFHGEPAQVLLKGLQIATGSTLGLLAWDRNDRPTAARRYKETLDLAISHPAFNDIALSSPHFERWIAHDVQTMKDNLFMLMQNDSLNVALLKAHGIEGGDLRKQTIAIPNVKVTGDQVEFQGSIQLATDACASCSTRGVKLQRCGRCKKVAYCGQACQKDHWKSHKSSCSA